MEHRKVTQEDYLAIALVVLQTVDIVKATVNKAIANRVCPERVMSHIIASDNAWIVDDTYLVVYYVVTPWYSPLEISEIREELVLRLKPGSNFSKVPEFLAQRMVAEGVTLAAVGTSLAKSDDALAAQYEQSGFRREATMLTLTITE